MILVSKLLFVCVCFYGLKQSQNTQNLGQYPAILTKQARSMKDVVLEKLQGVQRSLPMKSWGLST